MSRYTEYDPFAWIYDRHWGEHTIRTFCPIVEAVALPGLPPGARILDLCCGTGHLARCLTDRGYRVTGLDGSEAMLHFARENAPDATFVLADARDFTLPPVHRAVISTYDSLNHLLTFDELTAACRNARAALGPGGIFFGDMNIREGFVQHWKNSFGIVEEDHVCVVRTRYDDDTRLAYWDLTIFRLGNAWKRTDLTLIQYAYEADDIRRALTDAGFAEVTIYDAEHAPEGVALPRGRAFFLARKEQSDDPSM